MRHARQKNGCRPSPESSIAGGTLPAYPGGEAVCIRHGASQAIWPFRRAKTVPRRELPAAALAFVAVLLLMVLVFLGSRGLKDFDSALIGYAVGTVFAFGALVYRYTLWIGRPATSRYFGAGWRIFLSWQNFRRYTPLVPKAWFTDILAQTFIRRRGVTRWIMHLSIFWGVVLSLAITIPLTFGWIRFTLVPPDQYQAWFFGIPVLRFSLGTLFSFLVFHALDFTAALLLIGLLIAFWRRTTDAGLLLTQRFGFDFIPLVLLFAIAVTGLALTASSLWWEGRLYWFISLTHQVTVVGWLLLLPFGKFFHIIERPAPIGVTLYHTVNQDLEARSEPNQSAQCRRCGDRLPSAQLIRDLRATLQDLGQEYHLGDDVVNLQTYCPTCKRILRGQAHFQMLGKRFL
jgi:hypothetical protein